MIRITKGAAPQRLIGQGAARGLAHCLSYDLDPPGYEGGIRKFDIAEGIFAHREVKEALTNAQHHKCCYCEAKPEKPYAHLHVEHWRPKAYSQQSKGGSRISPGYYWLAYDWDNLFLACHFCNSINKGNIFPLFNPTGRARSHKGDLALERPKLLKPDVQDPRDHIAFHEEVPIGISPEGKETVKVLGLDRTEHEGRLRLLNTLKVSHALVLKYANDPAPAALEIITCARQIIDRAVLPDAPFSAMAIAFLDRSPLPV